MGAIAKWLILGVAAAAQADGGASGQAKRFAFRVVDFEIAFHSDRAVGVDGDFRRHSLDPSRTRSDAIIKLE